MCDALQIIALVLMRSEAPAHVVDNASHVQWLGHTHTALRQLYA